MASGADSNFPPPPPSGSPPPPDAYGAYGPLPTGRATASMVCGIVGLVVFGIILGPIAIWLGMSAKNDPRQGGDGMAKAGIVLGIVDLIAAILLIMYLTS